MLISPQLLRSRGLGQIDLARLRKTNQKWLIEMTEVKSSLMGEEAMLRGQAKRLGSAQNFLSGLFGHPSRFIRFFSQENLSSAGDFRVIKKHDRNQSPENLSPGNHRSG